MPAGIRFLVDITVDRKALYSRRRDVEQGKKLQTTGMEASSHTCNSSDEILVVANGSWQVRQLQYQNVLIQLELTLFLRGTEGFLGRLEAEGWSISSPAQC